jgi:hypothetical protein
MNIYKSKIPFVKDKKIVKYMVVFSEQIGVTVNAEKARVLSINIYEDDQESLGSFKQLVEQILKENKGVTKLSVDEFPDDLKENPYYFKDNLIEI